MADRALRERFRQLADLYEKELFSNVLPFWLTYAIDRVHGGLCSCIADDGKVLSYDKYMWSQLRAIWVFSRLYNRFGQVKSYLRIATDLVEFVLRVGRDGKGRWVFAVGPDGRPIQGASSIYTDLFAIYALTEYARATPSIRAEEAAMDAWRKVQGRLEHERPLPVAPYEIPPGHICHGVSMMCSLAFYELGLFMHDPRIAASALEHSRRVMDVFRRPELEVLLEYVGESGQVLDTPAGRTIVPGHAVESMWFQIHIHRLEGDKARVRQACDCIRWHMEKGWDEKYGGLLLGLDLRGKPPYWKRADTKLWWPMTEAMVALLLAYEVCREPWCLEWHRKVHEWAFANFPDRLHGEWHQKLERDGKIIQEPVTLPVKDPFHLPRALIYCIDICRRLAG